jgi:hypothetical protein
MAPTPSQPGSSRGNGRANSLGLDDKLRHEILNHLDATQSAEAAKRRTYNRIQYRRCSVVLAVKPPGGIDTVTKVACRNLSSGGISVLHSAFLHPGSACVVVLEHPVHGNTPVKGRVARCQHRAGLVHEIGICFDEQIKARDFVESDTPGLTLESVHPDKLTGTIAHFSPDASQRQALRDHLRDLPVQLKSVATLSHLDQQIALGVGAVFFQPAELATIETQLKALRQRTPAPICILVTATTHPLTLPPPDTGILTLAWPTTPQILKVTLAEMLLVLAPRVVKGSVNQENETLIRLTVLAQTLSALADAGSAGAVAKTLSEISRLATLIARHDLVDLTSRARSAILDLTKPEPARLQNILKPVLATLVPPAASAAA